MNEKIFILTITTFIFLYSLLFTQSAHALSWSEDNPDEMEPGDTITLSIEGDCPPYTWKAAGKGYSLEASVTQDEVNALSSNWRQCGSALLTVVDSCGGRIEGSARGGRGQWIQQGEIYRCIPPCPPLTSEPPCRCYINAVVGSRLWSEELSGNIKQEFLNFSSFCVDGWDECPYLGGTIPEGGGGTIFTYYLITSKWQCPDIELQLPSHLDTDTCP